MSSSASLYSQVPLKNPDNTFLSDRHATSSKNPSQFDKYDYLGLNSDEAEAGSILIALSNHRKDMYHAQQTTSSSMSITNLLGDDKPCPSARPQMEQNARGGMTRASPHRDEKHKAGSDGMTNNDRHDRHHLLTAPAYSAGSIVNGTALTLPCKEFSKIGHSRTSAEAAGVMHTFENNGHGMCAAGSSRRHLHASASSSTLEGYPHSPHGAHSYHDTSLYTSSKRQHSPSPSRPLSQPIPPTTGVESHPLQQGTRHAAPAIGLSQNYNTVMKSNSRLKSGALHAYISYMIFSDQARQRKLMMDASYNQPRYPATGRLQQAYPTPPPNPAHRHYPSTQPSPYSSPPKLAIRRPTGAEPHRISECHMREKRDPPSPAYATDAKRQAQSSYSAYSRNTSVQRWINDQPTYSSSTSMRSASPLINTSDTIVQQPLTAFLAAIQAPVKHGSYKDTNFSTYSTHPPSMPPATHHFPREYPNAQRHPYLPPCDFSTSAQGP